MNVFAILGAAALAALSTETTFLESEGDMSHSSSVFFDRVVFLEEESATSANASVGDLNGDGNLDIVLIKGRHWPVTNQLLFGDGAGGFTTPTSLNELADRSYTGALGDLDGDGDLDVVVSNDRPDEKFVYLNDGEGNFAVDSTFGNPQWSTRNVSIGDINSDGMLDVVVANRGPLEGPSPNYICLNLGNGRYQSECQAFSDESATTITPADLDDDGIVDLVVPHRDGGQSHVYLGQPGTNMRFEARPFGPEHASIRATAVADFDQNGALDIVAIHTGNSEGGDGMGVGGPSFRGTTIYYGLEGSRFSAGELIGNTEEMPYALALADINGDDAMDIIVGYVEASTAIYINARSGNGFKKIELGDSDGATYGFATGDLNKDGRLDIVVAKSGARNRVFFGASGTDE